MSEIKIGDTVSVTGVVYSTGTYTYIRVPENGDQFAVEPSVVTFVSRPEKTYTVELTKTELLALRKHLYYNLPLGKSGSATNGYGKLWSVQL